MVALDARRAVDRMSPERLLPQFVASVSLTKCGLTFQLCHFVFLFLSLKARLRPKALVQICFLAVGFFVC